MSRPFKVGDLVIIDSIINPVHGLGVVLTCGKYQNHPNLVNVLFRGIVYNVYLSELEHAL